VIRLQKKLKPYKLEENNQIEMIALCTGALTLYSGFIFTIEEGSVSLLYNLALVLTIAFNMFFILSWVFLIL